MFRTFVRIIEGVLCLFVTLGTFTTGCQVEKETIFIGVALELSGRQADLGVQIRNGVRLAVDSVNREGGIQGRPIAMIVRDDQGKPDIAQQVDRELIGAGVAAIIGHVTSQQSLAGLAVTQPAGVVLISATATSTELTGKEDLFFRIVSDNERYTRALAERMVERGIFSAAIIYDEDNASYSRTYAETFEVFYKELGGQVLEVVDFSGAGQPDFTMLVERVFASNPQGLLLITSAINAAFLVQKARLMNWEAPVFAGDWAYSEVFLQNGGQAIEGVEIITSFNGDTPIPALERFRKEYQDTFGTEPNFGAVQGYETAQVLIEALRRADGDPKGLPGTLSGIRDFEGLSGEISIDSYGDGIRPLYLVQVQGGKWVTHKVILEP
ncbi:MAG: ABC transporter substrate-binding protein [Anaerolineaceae bacterium]|nr:ABC transporter substrate-binding protein [Anaerolineaceae bacterium]